jgi:sialic acid synthase SpsE
MAQIILDMGSGNTCRNSIDYAKRMIDTVAAIDSHKHSVILKWQLEEVSPPGQLKLDREVFRVAYEYAKEKGYQTTSSVFDKSSLYFLLTFDIPFVKIACRSDLYWLIGEIPPEIWTLASTIDWPIIWETRPYGAGITWMQCVPKYPAQMEDYRVMYWDANSNTKWQAFSDHTEGLGLWKEINKDIVDIIWEKHFVLERSPDNPDSGVFALTPDQLAEVIG